MEIIESRESEEGSMDENTICVGLARVSSDTQRIVSGTLKELAEIGKSILEWLKFVYVVYSYLSSLLSFWQWSLAEEY